MILYYSPGACSLADHIALREADMKFDLVKVDLKSHKLEDGRSFTDINPKAYVPVLQFRRRCSADRERRHSQLHSRSVSSLDDPRAIRAI